MKLWKVAGWEVRQVEGEPWPGNDSEGDTCFKNTHYALEADALAQLFANARARLSTAEHAVVSARSDLALAENECVYSALLVDRLEGKN